MYRFSGHETFHCKEQWLIKGLQLIEIQIDKGKINEEIEIQELGVGKNMVKSIQHWLRAFGWVNEDNQISELAAIIYKNDPHLENDNSSWILQYSLCNENYASIFRIILYDYFSDKVTNEFSETSLVNYITRKLQKDKLKPVAENTLRADIKVFIKTYLSPKKNIKTVEDDFNAPLLPLGLILDTQRKNSFNEPILKINKLDHQSISPDLFVYFILDSFPSETVINLDSIRKKLGSYLCLSIDGIENLITTICNINKDFVFKDDAGIKQLQVKSTKSKFEFISQIYAH